MSEDRPHLRPVPAPGAVNEAVARDLAAPEEPGTGLIPPSRRGGAARFISDVIVELGFAPAEAEKLLGRAEGDTVEDLIGAALRGARR